MSNNKIERAKATAATWARQHREHLQTPDHSRTSPAELIRLAESTKPLTPAQLEALDGAWFAMLGEPLCEPDDDADDDDQERTPAPPEPEMPADDTMLATKEVLRITGVSLSSLKRMVIAGRFPKPLRLSPRKLGWPAGEVKEWLAILDEQRRGRQH